MRDFLRIGLIGCGAMGQLHLDLWRKIEGVAVVAISDAMPGRAVQIAKQEGARGYDSLEAMLEAGGLDAVDICTPSGLHSGQGLLAARNGLHILCEKPLDVSLKQADIMLDECLRNNVRLGCVFQRRGFRGAQQVARMVQEGRMGRIISCSAAIKWWRDPEYYKSGGWRGTLALDGGVLSNQAIHALDHLCWLAGRVVEVEYACLSTLCHEMEAEDNALAVLRFESGARGVLEATTCCSPDLCSRLEIYGENGSALFDDAQLVRLGFNGRDCMDEIEQDMECIGGRSDPMALNSRGHEVIFRDFVDAIKTGRAPLVDASQARMSLEALDMIYKKAM